MMLVGGKVQVGRPNNQYRGMPPLRVFRQTMSSSMFLYTMPIDLKPAACQHRACAVPLSNSIYLDRPSVRVERVSWGCHLSDRGTRIGCGRYFVLRESPRYANYVKTEGGVMVVMMVTKRLQEGNRTH